MEVEIVGLTAVSDSEEEGSVTISARKTLDICRSLPEGATLKFSSSEGKASIQSGKSKFMLSTLPASEFPTVDEGEKALSSVFQERSAEVNRINCFCDGSTGCEILFKRYALGIDKWPNKNCCH